MIFLARNLKLEQKQNHIEYASGTKLVFVPDAPAKNENHILSVKTGVYNDEANATREDESKCSRTTSEKSHRREKNYPSHTNGEERKVTNQIHRKD